MGRVKQQRFPLQHVVEGLVRLADDMWSHEDDRNAVHGEGVALMSMFVWLDYSEHERRKMLDVVDLFREHDTRDELGIGSVRDQGCPN